MNIIIPPKKATLALGTVIAFLICSNAAVQYSTFFLGRGRLFGLVRLFDLNGEMNIPTLYATLSLMLCSLLLMIIGVETKRRGEAYSWHWIGLSAVFLFLSFDEYMTFHEEMVPSLRSLMNTSGILYFAWVIPYAAFVLLLSLIYRRFLFRLPRKTRSLFVLSAFIYCSAVLTFELVEGPNFELNFGAKNLSYAVMCMIEESLEMIGILVFLHALMSYIDSELEGFRLNVSFSPPTAVPPEPPSDDKP